MPSSKKLPPPLAEIIGARVAVDESTDRIVQLFDDLIYQLASETR